jgi:glucokinase
MGISYKYILILINMKLVFNIGGTKTKLAISPDGITLAQTSEFPTRQDWEEELTELIGEVKKMTGRDPISGIAGGVAGVWDENRSKLIFSPHLTKWLKKPIKKDLEKEFGVSVALNNDVALEGLGEASAGAGRRKQIVGYLAVGTGIGGVKIVEGKIDPAVAGFEPGHQIFSFDETVGYWEDFASGSAIEKLMNKRPEQVTDPDVWEKETRLLSIGIHNAIVMWSPEMVILNGGVMQAVDIEKLKVYIAEEMRAFPSLPEIVRGELGDKAGLYGALVYMKQKEGRF